jgi:hypothetical protein
MTERSVDAADDRWSRPLWSPGGGDAFIYLVVFGGDAALLDIDTERYRVDEVPEGLDAHELDDTWVARFLDSPIGEQVSATDPATTDAALACDSCIVLTGTVADPPSLAYLRSAIGITAAALDTGGVAVLNLPTFHLAPADEWRTSVFDADGGVLPHFVTNLVSLPEDDDPDGPLWLHTRGLRTFGRPDLSIADVDRRDLDQSADLVTALANQLARGLVIDDGSTMAIGGEIGTLRFDLRGHLDDPNFNNVHLAITRSR